MEEEKKKKAGQRADMPEGYYNTVPKLGSKGPSKFMREISKGMSYFFVIAAGIAFYFALLRLPDISGVFWKAVNVLKPILYGMLFAFVLNPLVKEFDRFFQPKFEKKFNKKRAATLSRSCGIIISMVLLILIVTAILNLLIPELYKSIRSLVYTVPNQLNDLMRKLEEIHTDNSNLGKLIQTLIEQGTESVQSWLKNNLLKRTNEFMSLITSGLIDFVGEIFNAIIGLIVSVYMLFSKERFSKQSKKLTYSLFKSHHANIILHITQKANEIFGGFLVGKIVDSAIIGFLCFFVLSLLNMPYTLLVSVIVGVTNVIPFFGPYIGGIPSAILILLVSPSKGITFIIFILILQQIDGNFIGPKILGNSTGLSSFWVIFAILLGGGMFGFPGMLLGVPTFAVIYYIATLIINSRLQRKNLPESSDYYDEYSFVDDTGKYIISRETLERKKQEKIDRDLNRQKAAILTAAMAEPEATVLDRAIIPPEETPRTEPEAKADTEIPVEENTSEKTEDNTQE